MDASIIRCYEADLTHAAETGEQIFLRPAKETEVEFFRLRIGGIPGEGPHVLYVIVAKNGRVFVSAPRDICMPKYTEKELGFMFDQAQEDADAYALQVGFPLPLVGLELKGLQ